MLLAETPAVDSKAADNPAYDPASAADERDRAMRAICIRRGQPAFRAALLAAYDGRCAVTGCNVEAVLEAAHISPYTEPSSDHACNGLLLRADIHTLFDCGLLAFDPATRQVVLADRLSGSEDAHLASQPLREPGDPAHRPKPALPGSTARITDGLVVFFMVFDDIPRPDIDWPDQHEAAFAYLNRSGRPEAARVRQLVEDWLARYPADGRDAQVARLRSTIDDQHRAAFFELFVHELLLTRGHRIMEIEPKLPHTPKSPDFLVQAKEGHRCYLECIVATGRSQQEVAAQARLNQALTALDRTSSPHHFLDLTVHGVPTAPISIRAMTNALLTWIDGLPDGDSTMDAAPFQYQEPGATISLRAFRRRHQERVGRAIGARFFPARHVTVDEDVRGALEKKALWRARPALCGRCQRAQNVCPRGRCHRRAARLALHGRRTDSGRVYPTREPQSGWHLVRTWRRPPQGLERRSIH